MSCLATVTALAAQQFGRDPGTIDVDARVDQLGIDSLGFLEFMFELEDKLGVSIPQESVQHVRTLAELAQAIDALVEARANGRANGRANAPAGDPARPGPSASPDTAPAG